MKRPKVGQQLSRVRLVHDGRQDVRDLVHNVMGGCFFLLNPRGILAVQGFQGFQIPRRFRVTPGQEQRPIVHDREVIQVSQGPGVGVDHDVDQHQQDAEFKIATDGLQTLVNVLRIQGVVLATEKQGAPGGGQEVVWRHAGVGPGDVANVRQDGVALLGWTDVQDVGLVGDQRVGLAVRNIVVVVVGALMIINKIIMIAWMIAVIITDVDMVVVDVDWVWFVGEITKSLGKGSGCGTCSRCGCRDGCRDG